MDKIVSIDEAIKILLEYKEKGGKEVILSEKNSITGIMQCGIRTKVESGIKVIHESQNPIAYSENKIMRSLITEKNKTYRAILFH